MENPIKMDDSGVPLFSETSDSLKNVFIIQGDYTIKGIFYPNNTDLGLFFGGMKYYLLAIFCWVYYFNPIMEIAIKQPGFNGK